MDPVLVTGATGFIGQALALALKASGATVVALVRPAADASLLASSGVELRRGDVREPRSLEGLCRGVDTVFHLAGSYRFTAAAEAELHATNVEGSVNVLRAALAAGARRFVLMSTVGVHGAAGRRAASEDAPLRPSDPYQSAKVEAEQRLREIAAATGIEAVVIRPAGVYGPGDRRFLKLFRALDRRRFVMIGSGATLQHLVYIDDLVAGVILAGRAERAAGRSYILAGPDHCSLAELVKRVAAALGRKPPGLRVPYWPVGIATALSERLAPLLGIDPPLHRGRVAFFRVDRVYDIGRARRELGYEPRVGLERGLAMTVAWYREQGWL